MSSIGNVLGAIGGGGGSYSGVDVVKNPRIQNLIQGDIGQLGTLQSQNQKSLSQFITEYLGNLPQARTYTGQEVSGINQFYNGGMASQLAGLRSTYGTAVNNAADVAAQQAIRNVDASRLGEGGGPSSYDTRLMISSLAPIRTGTAVDLANQQRSDLGYITQNQLGLTGQRTALDTALAGYGLVPNQARTANFMSNIGALQGLTSLDQANNQYGVKYTPDTLETVGSSLSGFMTGLGSDASTVSSIMGMGIGSPGGSKGGNVPNYNTTPAMFAGGQGYTPPSNQYGAGFGYDPTVSGAMNGSMGGFGFMNPYLSNYGNYQ